MNWQNTPPRSRLGQGGASNSNDPRPERNGRAVLSPVAQNAVDQARRLSAASGRPVPNGDDLLMSLLALGVYEPPFSSALESAGVSALALRRELLSQRRAAAGSSPESALTTRLAEARASRFWDSVMEASEDIVDCVDLVVGLVSTEYLSDDARYLLADSGLTIDVLLAAADTYCDYAAVTMPAAKSVSAPPLGFYIEADDLPALVGRDEMALALAEGFRTGARALVSGPAGCGRAILARHGAALSGRTAIHVRAEELASIAPDGRYEAMSALLRWLRETEGGLVLTDVDLPALSKTALPDIDVPLIVTATGESACGSVMDVSDASVFALAPLDRADALAALEAWGREPTHPLVPLEHLADALDLATTYLDPAAVMPGAAIDLIRAASDPKRSTPVTRSDLEDAVCYMTGLPLALVSEGERIRLANMADRLSQRLIGQRSAVETVARSIVRRSLTVGKRTRPIGSFLFVGPTGVGKTELARVLTTDLFGSTDFLVRFDMAEFFDHHEIARLIGSPPGYVGSQKDGQLIEAVKKRGRGVLLLDEIEKADHRLYDFFLGGLDYGVITASNSGEKVSLADWVVVFTSNVGSAEGAAARGRGALGFAPGGLDDPDARTAVASAAAVKAHFASRPEFVNRLDAIVEFGPLSRAELGLVLDLRFGSYASELASIGMIVDLGPALAARMVAEASASGMGARDLVTRRFADQVEDRVSAALLAGAYARGGCYLIEIGPDGVPVLRRTDAALIPLKAN